MPFKIADFIGLLILNGTAQNEVGNIGILALGRGHKKVYFTNYIATGLVTWFAVGDVSIYPQY